MSLVQIAATELNALEPSAGQEMAVKLREHRRVRIKFRALRLS
jgi:hypothetical protein